MEFLIVFIVLVVGAMMLAGWLGLGLFAYGERTRKKADADAPRILDQSFDGSPNVVFKINMESPAYETVVLGAKARGYALAHETNNTSDGRAKTLIFEKVG